MSVVFDKLSFMRHLESDGTFARPQAEKLSDALHQAIQESVATKADIARLEARIEVMDARIDAKIAGVDAKLAGVDGKIAGVEASIANMKVWNVGVGVALFSALAAIRFFGH